MRSTETYDDLDDPPAPTGPCDCESGWRTVKEPYARAEAQHAGPEGSAQYAQRFASASNTVYPCRTCRPGMFFRWAEGHLSVEHDRGNCAACLEMSSSSPPRRRRAHKSYDPGPPAPLEPDEPPIVPERRDIDG